jgi:CHU_C Type IX secretion signal domain
MIKKLAISIALLLPIISWGQIAVTGKTAIGAIGATTITSNGSFTNASTDVIDLSKAKLVLASQNTRTREIISTTSPLTLGELTINSITPYTLNGNWTIINNITFSAGILLVGNTDNLIYTGTSDLTGKDASYVNGRIYMKGANGSRTFPIGNNDGYFPVLLTDVSESDNIGMEVTKQDPNFSTSTEIKEIFKDHFWQLTSSSPLKSETQISLSNNKVTFTTTGGTIVLEKDASTQNNLGGTIDIDFFTSANTISSTGKIYGLAKSDKVNVIIHKLITPDNDTKNDGLFIENIELFPDNEVTLIDRYGVPFKTWTNFTNTNQEGTDFTKLASGNYICIVKYKEFGKEVSLKPQMISVLK